MSARFTYEAEYTGDGKRGRISDTLSDFEAYVDRDDVWTEGVDEVSEAIVDVLNEQAREIPQPAYPDDDE